jgi:hypothetical protein
MVASTSKARQSLPPSKGFDPTRLSFHGSREELGTSSAATRKPPMRSGREGGGVIDPPPSMLDQRLADPVFRNWWLGRIEFPQGNVLPMHRGRS